MDIRKLQIPAGIVPSECDYLYRVVRKYKPTYIVETGSGASSISFLLGLADLGSGILISIDQPNFDGCRKERDIEEVERLWQQIREHYPEWVIYNENIITRLPLVTRDLPRIDLFFHDSNHTSEHVFYEFKTVVPHMNKGALFGMHDIRHDKLQQFITTINANKNFRYIGKCRQLGFWRKVQ